QHDHRVARLRGGRHVDRIGQGDGSIGARNRQMSGFIVAPETAIPLLAPHRVEPAVVRPEPSSEGSQIPFGDVLKDAVQAANVKGIAADNASQAFAAGSVDDIHGTMIAVKEADIQVRLLANVRNKLLDAFYELWRMNV